MKWLIVAVIAVVGVLAAVVAGVYFTEQIHQLPSFFPGHGPIGKGIRYKRGAAAAVVAVVLWLVAVVIAMAGRRRTAAPAV